jgi:hypothetical protein
LLPYASPGAPPGVAPALCHDTDSRCAVQRRTGPSGSIAFSWWGLGKRFEIAALVPAHFVHRSWRAVN